MNGLELILYNTVDSENVINKSLSLKYTLDIKLKKDTDIVEPFIVIDDKKTMNLKECNYCFISEFNRYYFIRSIESMNNNLWGLRLECDVLESFKNDILTSECEVNRNIKAGDYQNFNSESSVIPTITNYESTVSLDDSKTIILSSLGGAVE